MKKSLGNRLAGKKKSRVRLGLTLIFLFAFAGVSVLLGFTHEKARKVEVLKKSEDVRVKNIGCGEEALNPLQKCEDEELREAVVSYYRILGQEEDFVESYDDFHIYTKEGQYRNTYVVFIRYSMKIKDIYTKVPGLGTLYAVRDETGSGYQLGREQPKGQAQEYVRRLTEHGDVQKLFEETEEEYEAAIQSDALLREAVADLKKASDISKS